MTKYYHFTSYSNLESISKTGLIQQTGDRCKSIGDKRCAVFLSKGIEGAIKMYGSFQWHYSQFCGEKGLNIIKQLKEDIKHYDEEIKKYTELGTGWEVKPMECKNEALREIESIKQILQYADFMDYLGYGCYLSISGITGPSFEYPKDCAFKKNIPSKKISVVTLKSKDSPTEEAIDSREAVLAHFMSTIQLHEFIHKMHNVLEQQSIMNLYHERYDEIMIYGYENYTLEEVPITEYINQKRKVLK